MTPSNRHSPAGISHFRFAKHFLFLLATNFVLLTGLPTHAQAGQGSAPAGAVERGRYSLIPEQSRLQAPDLSLTDIDGRKLSLAQFRGKVVLLDFWAVDCGGCVIEIPWYVEFDSKFHGKGLQPVGIDMYGETPSYIKPFMQKTGMNYPVAVGADEIRARFKADELPKTMLIDRNGRVALSHTGIVDKASFEAAIQQLLK